MSGNESDFFLLSVSMFSKQTSKAASACEVKATRVSPTTSLGFPYSLPTASLIYMPLQLAQITLDSYFLTESSEECSMRNKKIEVSLFWKRLGELRWEWVPVGGWHTWMLTCCPSPLEPLRVAVTRTRVSLDTKFRMQRGCWPLGFASSSKRRADVRVAANDKASVALANRLTILNGDWGGGVDGNWWEEGELRKS